MKLFKEKFSPMLLSEQTNPFDDKNYIYEIKFDGIRACIHVSPKEFIIYSRNGTNLTQIFPELKEIQSIIKEKIIFDGEIVLFQNGKPNFSKLQERLRLKNKTKIENLSNTNPVCFIAFDILYKNKDLTNKTLIERKEILNNFKDTNLFIKTKYIMKEGKKLFSKIKKLNLEGIVAKQINSTYEINTRSKSWIKIKNYKTEKFYIGGYLDVEKNNMSRLYLGEYRNRNFYYVGKTLINRKTKLYEKLTKESIKKKSPFKNYEEKNVNYLTPKIICTVSYTERTKNNNLRHAKLKI